MKRGIVPRLCCLWGAVLLAFCLTACQPVEDAGLPEGEPAAQAAEPEPPAMPEPEPEPEPVEITYLAHTPYMQGLDGYFFPDRPLTRAEMAQVLVNLFLDPEAEAPEIPEALPEPEPSEASETPEIPETPESPGSSEETAEPESTGFSDVMADSWYASSVALAADLLPGDAEGTFRPEDSITLTELTGALCRALEPEVEPEPEMASDESESEVETEPEQADGMELPLESEPVPDSVVLAVELGWIEAESDPAGTVTRGQAAAIFNRALGRTPDREALDTLECLVFLDLDPAHPDYYDVLECTLPHEYLEEDGECWNEESLLNAGIRPGFHKAGGYANYVLEDGTILTEPGFFNAGDDTYLISEQDGQVYADDALHVVDGRVVFATADGTLLKNESWNDYQFDAEGFYTTGDEALDGYVAEALAACTTEEMTQEEKLRACYEYVRSFKYLGRNATLPSTVTIMPMENAVAYANKIFETGKGDCYNFAASFCFLARALGYEATAVVGSCGYVWSSVAIAHGWVEIVLDEQIYLFDPQIENYNLRAGISNETHSAFQVTYETAPGRYYKN